MANIAELLAKAKAKKLEEQKASIIATAASNAINSINNQVKAASQKEIQSFPAIPAGVHTVSMNEVSAALGGDDHTSLGMHGEVITLNAKQYEAARRGGNGESIVVIGPAGSGKTTTQRALSLRLMASGHAGIIADIDAHKYMCTNRPGIVVCSYTRRATNNIREVLPAELKNNCMTIHRLLEFEPFEEEATDADGFVILDNNGKAKINRGFRPNRNKDRPLPQDIKTIVIEESGMVSLDLHQQLMDAIAHDIQVIYLGDIYQLTPPMGDGILAYKMLELPVVELTEVYRNKSHILNFATDIKDGIIVRAPAERIKGELNPRYPTLDAFKNTTEGKIDLRCFRKKSDPITVNVLIKQSLIKELEVGNYDPVNDIILCPYDKERSKSNEELVSCVNINKAIAGYLSAKRGSPTWEIIAGRVTHYFAVGDKVLFDKRDAIIKQIKPNPKYIGKHTRKPNIHIDRWGFNSHGDDSYDMDSSEADVIDALAQMDNLFDMSVEDVTNQASHIVTISYGEGDDEDDGYTEDLASAGAVNKLMFGYAITVYKSQGAEWRKVYCVFHHSHSRMITNECLYTAVTRAREQLVIYCEPDTFSAGVLNREIKGKTLEEKARFMMRKQSERQNPKAMSALASIGLTRKIA